MLEVHTPDCRDAPSDMFLLKKACHRSDEVQVRKQVHKVDLEVVKENGAGFIVLPRRWVVERTFTQLLNYHRRSKDYGVLNNNSEAFIQVAMIQLLIRRLAKK